MVKPSQESEIFGTVMNFFRDSCSFPSIKTLLKYQSLFSKKNPERVNNLNKRGKFEDLWSKTSNFDIFLLSLEYSNLFILL